MLCFVAWKVFLQHVLIVIQNNLNLILKWDKNTILWARENSSNQYDSSNEICKILIRAIWCWYRIWCTCKVIKCQYFFVKARALEKRKRNLEINKISINGTCVTFIHIQIYTYYSQCKKGLINLNLFRRRNISSTNGSLWQKYCIILATVDTFKSM